jgi:hypothetical protein
MVYLKRALSVWKYFLFPLFILMALLVWTFFVPIPIPAPPFRSALVSDLENLMPNFGRFSPITLPLMQQRWRVSSPMA